MRSRLLPDSIADSYFSEWKQTQARHRALVEERFAPVPIRELPLFRDEVVPAMAQVRAAADALEAVVPDELWPLPTYQEMLFIK